MTRERICICKVCHCGSREKCKHDIKAARKSSSEYSFGGFEKHHELLDFTPPVCQKPKDHLPIPCETMDHTTDYEEEYVPMPLPPVHRPSKAKYFPPCQEFPSETEYKFNYYPKNYHQPIDPPKSMKPPQLYKPSPPFQEMSTYQRSYRPLNLAEIMKHRAVSARPPNLWEGTPEFEDKTIYQEEYRPFPDAERAVPFRPRLTPLSDVPFEGKTMYNEYFIPRPLPSIKPVIYKDKSGLLQTDSGLQMPFPESTAKKDYTPHKGASRRTSVRPPRTPAAFADEPLAKATTYRDDYWARPIEKKEPLPPLSDRTYDARCRSPYFTFSDDTAYRTTTTTKTSFKSPPADYRPPKSYKPIIKHIPPKEVMEDSTTFSSSYKGEYFPPAQPFPQWSAEMQERFKCLPMSTRTEYKDRFHTTDYWKQKKEKRHLETTIQGMDGDTFDHNTMECCCRYCKCGNKDELIQDNQDQYQILTKELVGGVC